MAALKEWQKSKFAPTRPYDAAVLNVASLLDGSTVCPWFPEHFRGVSVGSSEKCVLSLADFKQQEARTTEELEFIRDELCDMERCVGLLNVMNLLLILTLTRPAA